MAVDQTQYNKWFTNAPDAIFIFQRTGEIIAANKHACHILGYKENALLQKNMFDLDPGSVISGVFGIGKEGDLRKWPHSSRRLLERFDGYSEPVEVRVSPIDETSGVSTFVAIVRDVNQEISLERQLLQAQKMEAIGTLAGGIAHDFNNILAAILGYGQIVKDQLPVDSPLRKDMDQILNGGFRATDLVKQILTFSRQGKEEYKPTKIHYLLKEVLILLRASLPATIDLQHSIDMNCGLVKADASQIHQVLMNLCTNAKHAIGDESGILSVHLTEKDIQTPEAAPGSPLVEPGKYVVLSVEDTGDGMDEDTLIRVFEPFFTTKGKDEGSGLGLSIVHGIVAKHQGAITVVSKKNKGTAFHVYLPVVEGNITKIITVEEVAVRCGNEKIMVVDDEATVSITLKRMLEKDGYNITIFNDSLEAVTAYRNNPDYFDLVITDMTMPKMTGLELVREMLAFRPDFPIVLMSGFSELNDREKALEFGVRDFLSKPFSRRELSEALRKVFDNG